MKYCLGRPDLRDRPGRRFPFRVFGTSAFSLVELIVAIVLFSVGLLALLSTAVATTRHMETAFSQVEAKAHAARHIERLRSARCSAGDTVENRLQHVTVVIERRTVARVSADTFYATIAC